jgi:gliding motility-associated lipoprotein GldH
MRITFSTTLLILILLTACDQPRVYEQNIDIGNKIWVADSLLSFQFDPKDISKNYNLYFNIRNTAAYPFENIYVTYYLKDTLGNELKKKLINYNLFDPKTGKPFGSGLGDVFDHQFLILENYKFERPGPYVFQLQQYMRRDSLPEIMSAGLRVEVAVTE